MTDAPFTETLRSFSKLCGGGNEDVAAAIDAALAEIDRLETERNQIEQKAMEWCHATQEARAEIDRLTRDLAVQILLVDTYSTRWEEAEAKLAALDVTGA